MSITEQQDKIKRAVDQRNSGLQRMIKSERVNVACEAALQMCGNMEMYDNGRWVDLELRVMKAIVVFAAKYALFWKPEDIENSIKSGRELAEKEIELQEVEEKQT